MAGATKVAIDANIAIAASIRDDLRHAGPVKHRIHDEASSLVKYLAGSGNGYVVPTVRSEAIGALPRAVAHTMLQRRPGIGAAEAKPVRYAAVMRSSTRLDDVFRSMNAVRPDPEQTAHNLALAVRMSESLMDRYEALACRGTVEHGRAMGAIGAAGRARLPREALQLGRFAKNHPNKGDRRILAEVAASRDSLPSGSRVVIASSDTGFFSPYRHAGGVSDTVTAEMRKRFGILRDRPEAILRMVRGAA